MVALISTVVSLRIGDEQVIRVKGDIDFSNVEDLRQALWQAIERGPKVVIDLSQASSVDSSGIATLCAACQQARESGVNLSLPAASDSIIRILHMSGLASTFGLALIRSDSRAPAKEKPDMRRQDWRITESVVLAEEELAVSLRDMAVTAALEAGLDPESVTDVRVAVTEALTNALRHGSPEPGKSKVRLRCMSCPKALVIEVVDEGEGISEDDLSQTGVQDADRAIGLRLMMAAMDEVEFLRDEKGSKVRMLKWIRNDTV